MDKLKSFPLVYLGTVYSKHPKGIEVAFQEAAQIAANLMKQGVKVYSPIAHTHPLAIYGNVDPYDHSIWLPFDEAMMEASAAMVVAMMEKWEESKGIRHEIDYFRTHRKPVFFYDPYANVITNNQ